MRARSTGSPIRSAIATARSMSSMCWSRRSGVAEREVGHVDDVDEGGVVAGATGDVDGFEREVAAGLPFERGVVGDGERGEQPGPVGCRVGADAVERGLDDRLGVVVADLAPTPCR